MSVVYKYALSLGDNLVTLPDRAELLHCAVQGGQIMLWALVETKAKLRTRIIGVVGTGHPLGEDGELHAGPRYYVGSVHDGPFVWHVFDGGWK